MGFHGLGVEVRHQGVFQFGETAADLHSLLAKQPRHTIGVGAMQAAVAGQQTKGQPALVNMVRCSALKTTHIVAPKAEAAQTQAQTATNALSHGNIGGVAVAAPVHREFLTAHGSAAGKQAGLLLAALFDNGLPDDFIVQVGVVVVHPHRVRAIKPLYIRGDALAEVGLEHIHALPQQMTQLLFVPCHAVGVGKIIDGATSLPGIPLPDIPVGALEQVALLGTVVPYRRLLTQIGVDPHADLQSTGMDAGEQSLHIREHLLIPLKAAPLVFLQPEAVEVEHGQRDMPLGHAIDKAGDGLFVVAGGERAGQPQTKGPCRGQGRTTGQSGIILDHGLGVSAADDHIIQLFAGHAELHSRHVLGGDLKADGAAVIDQHTVAAVGQVERNVFITDLAGRAAVLVPDVHHLTVLDKIREPLAQTVDLFAHIQLQLCTDKRTFRCFHVAQHGGAVAVADAGDALTLVVIVEGGRVLTDDKAGITRSDRDFLVGHIAVQRGGIQCQIKGGHLCPGALVMHGLHSNHIRLRGCDGYEQCRAIQTPLVLFITNAE